MRRMQRIRVWDLPQRLFHWSLAALVFFAWATAEDKGLLYILHTSAGYLIFLLTLFRVAWGFVGSTHARFSDFVYGWRGIRSYLIGLVRLHPPRHIGHNPLGGWAILLLLGLALVVTVTGMIGAAREPGALLNGVVSPSFSRSVRGLHEGLANVLIVLVFVHIAAVLLDWLLTRDNIVRAMIDGTKAVAPGESATPARGGRIWLGLLIAAPLAALGFYMFLMTRF